MFFPGERSCIRNPDVMQQGTVTIPSGQQVIVPTALIDCPARITNIAVSLSRGTTSGTDLPMIQIWRPSSQGSPLYNRIAQVQIPTGTSFAFDHFFVNMSISNSIELLPGDVIGYYQPASPQRLIWSIQTNGHTSYANNASSPGATIDINNVDNVETVQPLIEVMFGKNH